MTDGSSDNQSALLVEKIGLFEKILIVLMTLSTIEGPLSVNLE